VRGIIELACLPVRHPDTSVWCWHPRQIPLVQPVTWRELQKVGHRRPDKVRMRRFCRSPDIDIRFYDAARVIDVVTVNARAMILVLTNHSKPANRSTVTLAATGYPRWRCPLPGAIEIRFLCPQADDDRWPPRMRFRQVRCHHVCHGAAARQTDERCPKSGQSSKPVHTFDAWPLSSNDTCSGLVWALSDLNRFFTSIDNKGVVFTHGWPGTMRHFTKFHKPPVSHVGRFQSEIVSYGGRNIESGALIQVRFRSFVAKDILPMVGSERSRIFPLCISDSIAFADCNPSIFASGNSRSLVGDLKPRNNTRRFRPVAGMCLVIVRQRAVKRVLPRLKLCRRIITPFGRIGVVKATIIFSPLLIPGTRAIRDEIISARLFADPKNCGHDVRFPRERSRSSSGRRFPDTILTFFGGLDLSGCRIKRDQ